MDLVEPDVRRGNSRQLDFQDALVAFQLVDFARTVLGERGDKVRRTPQLLLHRAFIRARTCHRVQ